MRLTEQSYMWDHFLQKVTKTNVSNVNLFLISVVIQHCAASHYAQHPAAEDCVQPKITSLPAGGTEIDAHWSDSTPTVI